MVRTEGDVKQILCGFSTALRGHGRSCAGAGQALRFAELFNAERLSPMDVVLGPLIQVALIALNLYLWAIIISAVLSWLVAFNVINTSNRFVYLVGDFLHRITEPALRPIRSVVPVMGGVDLSPMVLILLIIFLEGVLGRLAMQAGAF